MHKTWRSYYYCNSRWLSRAEALHRSYELNEELAIFLSEISSNDDANSCYNEDIIQKLAYLVDIF
jgi:hypothetical protein